MSGGGGMGEMGNTGGVAGARWVERLTDELAVRGVRRHHRERIVAELRDHIACEPGCEDRLGDQRELARSFAEELATDGARRCALAVFAALALTAVALAVSQLAMAAAGGYPGFDHGRSLALFIPALLGMVIAPQAALVAGTLAAARALRRRRAATLPSAEIALIRRRAWVGVGAGCATALGLELYVLDFSVVLPAWWLALVGGLAALAGVALLAACVMLVRAGSLLSDTAGVAGDVFDDVPIIGLGWLRGGSWRLGLCASAAVAVPMTLAVWHAERSLIEGVERGAFEGLAAVAGFALLGKAIGVRSDAAARRRSGEPSLASRKR